MDQLRDPLPNNTANNQSLVLGALGRAFAAVGRSRDVEEWQDIGANLIAKSNGTISEIPDQPQACSPRGSQLTESNSPSS